MPNQHTMKRRKLTAAQIMRELIVPLDYAILDKLPDEGSVVGYHPLGRTVRVLAPEFEGVDSEQLSGRLKSMELMGLTKGIKVTPVGQGRGWQVTPLGKKLLKSWKENSNGPTATQ